MFPATILSIALLAAAATVQAVAPLTVSPLPVLLLWHYPYILYFDLYLLFHTSYNPSIPSSLTVFPTASTRIRTPTTVSSNSRPGSPRGPGNTAPLNTWAVNRNATAMSALGITSVAPSTYIAGYGYGTVQSSLSALAQRIFYQTTNGNIVSAYHSGLTGSPAWVVDTTIATNLPLGTPISAFIDVITASRVQVAVVQYTDANGFLTSTFSSLDVGGWSTPITVQV
ncbi:hypothetical protein B0H13DRAFT_1904602 [Mycena leptocephala]|nr:hypothetical protein B0H13DRAFT_1904602 [Mycena leptocephala]